MLMRTNNFPTLLTTQSATPVRLTNWLDEMFDDFNVPRGAFVPELNVYETEKEFQVTLALPGMNKEDIDISLENNTLVVSGERKFEEENGRRYHRVESRFGKFSRSLPLPDIIDSGKVSASYENGVLTVIIPKSEEKAGKKIPIK